MRPLTLYKLIVVASVISVILACNTLVPDNATPSPLARTALAQPTATLVQSSTPLAQELTLASVPVSEESQAPMYQIRAEIPTLQGSTDVNVVNFNTAMTNLVQAELDGFKKSVGELPQDSPSPGSSFDVAYALMLQRADFYSLKFDFSGYSAGAAHPYHYSKTANYDVGSGRELELSELFLPGSDYLTVIADYCIRELSQRDIFFEGVSEGAAPTPENYRNWNLTPNGLMITFDEYQVAPYAAGPQVVTVPYSALQTVINPQGPVASLVP